MMQILTDIRLLAQGGTTGTSAYTADLLEALFKLDTKNQYRLFYNAFKKRELPVGWHHQDHVRILDRKIPNRLLYLMFRFFNGPNLECFGEADLIFSPHFTILPKTKTPRVITFHDLSFIHHPEFFSKKQMFWHWLQNYKKQAQEATHIIAVSEFTKYDLVNVLKIPEEKVTVIYSGVNEEILGLHKDQEYQEKMHARYQFDKPYFLSLSTIEPRKNIIALIRAFAFLKEDPIFKHHQLVIAGKPGFEAEKVFAEAASSKHFKDIIFLHSVSDKDRVYLYSWSRAFVYPSFFEGFGFPPLEAQACSVPVVAADRTSIPEVLGKSALLFNPWSVTELVEKLYALETNDSLRRDIIERGRKNVARFRFEKTAQETLSVFNKTIGA